MKKQSGITMMVLVFAIIILIVLAGVTFSFVVGNRGGLAVASEEAFRYDMQQIKEKVQLKETEYELNEEKSSYAFTKNMEAQILEDYVGKLRIYAAYSNAQGRLVLSVHFKPSDYTPEQRQIMYDLGFIGDDLNASSTVSPNASNNP